MSKNDFSSGSPLFFRRAEDGDLPHILLIEQSVHSHPWKPAHFETSLSNNNLFYVAEAFSCSTDSDNKNAKPKNKEIVGYGIMSFGGGEAELLNIAVAEPHQGKSIASKLLNYLIDQIRDVADGVFLEVRESNFSAQQLYDKLGFNQVGIRPNYYPSSKKTAGGREDALIFALTIIPQSH